MATMPEVLNIFHMLEAITKEGFSINTVEVTPYDTIRFEFRKGSRFMHVPFSPEMMMDADPNYVVNTIKRGYTNV